MEPEVPASLHLEAQTGNAPLHQRCNVGLGRLSLLFHMAGVDAVEQRTDPANSFQTSCRSAVAETPGTEGAVVRLYRCDMPLELSGVGIPISPRTAAAVLLVGPQHHADGATRLKSEPANQAHRFPRRHRASAVIHRSLPHVPRVDMAAQHHHLLGQLPAPDFRDHVPRRCVG
jgi:hypothetical protein